MSSNKLTLVEILISEIRSCGDDGVISELLCLLENEMVHTIEELKNRKTNNSEKILHLVLSKDEE